MTNEELLTVLEARFDTIDARFEQIDTRFERIDARFEQIDARFERMETGLRHVNVQIESLWGETKRLGESIILVDEKLERFRAETTAAFDDQRAFNQMLLRRIEAL